MDFIKNLTAQPQLTHPYNVAVLAFIGYVLFSVLEAMKPEKRKGPSKIRALTDRIATLHIQYCGG